ncbi:MAG: formate/nitrite family transporter [Armatimonadota bacterium]
MADSAKPDATVSLDALMPAEMAAKAENIGVRKAELPFDKLMVLAILAGAFIGLGAEFCTVVVTGTQPILGFGVTKLLGGAVFSLGLILVVIAGAELFTGNALIIMAYASHKVSTLSLLRNWVIVYIGNLVGSLLTAAFIFLSRQHTFADGQLGVTALNIGNAKCSLDFWPALFLGVYCNALVCLAVWLCFSARTTTDRILAIVFPITAFVASGFEHCVANMYFIPVALFIKTDPAIVAQAKSVANLTWANFFVRNLLPVTIGNTIGGAVMVGAVYWWTYLRPSVSVPAAAEKLKAAPERLPAGARSVLVVDDDADFNFAVSTQLQHDGYDVRSAFSAHEARQAIAELRPDVVLLDVRMETDSAGVELVGSLRSDPATRNLPIILVSGAVEPTGHAADRFLSKPIEFSLLTKAVAEMASKG